MPNIGALLKQEIVRLSRREVRKELHGTKTVSAQHRGYIAALKRRLAGVSAQSVYNWEQGHATPRLAQVQALAALRVVGKREARRRLELPGGKR